MRRELQGQVDYIALPQKVANHTLRLLDKNWRSFFAAIKEWNKNKSGFTGRPCLPHYLDKNLGRYVVSYEKGAISRKELKKGFVKLSKTNISFPFINKEHKLVSARIVPTLNNEYQFEIIYDKPTPELKEDGIWAGIDIGVNNLMALTFAKENVRPILINGKPLKSINQFYNKKLSYKKSKL